MKQDRVKAYEPLPAPAEYDARYLMDELRSIANTLHSIVTNSISLVPRNVEPRKVYEGLIVYADGTDWNPGSGKGVYVYNGTAWVKL